MLRNSWTEKINVWPIGPAKLVQEMRIVPVPHKFIGIYNGYCFYKTRHGVFATSTDDPSNSVRNIRN